MFNPPVCTPHFYLTHSWYSDITCHSDIKLVPRDKKAWASCYTPLDRPLFPIHLLRQSLHSRPCGISQVSVPASGICQGSPANPHVYGVGSIGDQVNVSTTFNSQAEGNKKCAGSANRVENSTWTEDARTKAEAAELVTELEALEEKVGFLYLSIILLQLMCILTHSSILFMMRMVFVKIRTSTSKLPVLPFRKSSSHVLG